MFLRLDAGGQQQLKALSKQLQTGRDAIAQAEGADDGGAGVLGSLKAEERKAIMEFYIASAEAKVPSHMSDMQSCRAWMSSIGKLQEPCCSTN